MYIVETGRISFVDTRQIMLSAVETRQTSTDKTGAALSHHITFVWWPERTSILSQQETSVPFQRQKSVLPKQKTPVLSQQQTSVLSQQQAKAFLLQGQKSLLL